MFPCINQTVVNYLRGFCFKISFKLLKKISFDDTSDNFFVAYLVITSTISYFDKVLYLNCRNQLLLLSKDMQKEMKKLIYKNTKTSLYVILMAQGLIQSN